MKRVFLRGILLCILFAIFFLHSDTICSLEKASAAPRQQSADDKIVIVIDPGHGGENEGTIEAKQHMENGVPEKEMTLITAQAMYEELSLYDNIEVYMTRTEDENKDLAERAQFAADVQADFLFSIHYNASLNHNKFGSEVWISIEPPYHSYGYQFGYVQMETMRDMGLYLRGIKTSVNDKGTDYYGIIRESVALGIPSVIIEHCHVDEARDIPFCDTEEEWKAFGRADALSVAKYFGLSSTALGVDYTKESNELPAVSENAKVQGTLKDETPPDVCQVELGTVNYETGELNVTVSAADYDSPLIYYDYSIDGGNTYSAFQPWPGSDALSGTYTDTFTLNLTIPSGVMPSVIVRAYNLFDISATSNCLQSLEIFRYGEEETKAEETAPPTQTPNLPGTKTFRPANSDSVIDSSKEISFLTFLQICLIFVILLFIIVFVFQYISFRKRRKKRRQRRKDAGNNKNHNR